jgi:small-conductance mechanosensitive channel
MSLPAQILGNSIQVWLVALAAAVGAFVLMRIAIRLVAGRISRLATSTSTYLDDLVVDVLQSTRSFLLVAIALTIGARFLDLGETAVSVINTLTILSIVVQAGVWVNRGISFLLRRSFSGRMEEDPAGATMVTPLLFLSRMVVWTLVLLLALDNIGVNVTALVTGLGIGGIAIALALQAILGDLFASLSIVLDKPFAIGDHIVINEFSGSVEHVGLKTTRVRSLSGEQIVFSNSDLLNSRIRNFKRMSERRMLFIIGVTYQTTLDNLSRIPLMIREIIERQPQTRFERCHFKNFGDSSLNFETVYFVLDPEFGVSMDIQQAINLDIYRAFAEKGIEFAYPTRTLLVSGGGVLSPVGTSGGLENGG